MSISLALLEDLVDSSGAAARIEVLLPVGVRHRQLAVRTLILGMLLTLDGRLPAFLTEAHAALVALPAEDQARLGVSADWKTGPHLLTYRQVEHTCRLITRALGKEQPDGAPSPALQAFCDQLLEASIPEELKDATAALAADWTDVETWSRPPRHDSTECADPEAHWGHRNSNLPGPKGEMFFGYYLSLAVMTREENGPPVPELARRMTVCACDLDPARALAAVLLAMTAAGIPLGDVIDDSGYAHRDARAWALPLRNAGAQLVQDLHPRPQGHPRRRDHRQRKPVLPEDTQAAAGTRAAAARRARRAGRRARPANRRARPPQAWQAHRRRRRRLPPRHLPGRHQQDPLPAPPGLHETGPGPARDPLPATSTRRPAAPSRPSPCPRQ